MTQPTKRARLDEGADEASTPPDFTGKTIEVRVKGSTFYVHEKIACKTSTFFKNALKPEWTGIERRPVNLEDESSEMFNLYLSWLYMRKLDHLLDTPNSWSRLAKLYVMGERLMDSTLQDAVIATMIRNRQTGKGFPPPSAINMIYNKTTEISPGRRLMVDMCVWRDGIPWKEAKNMFSDMHPVFANDLLMGLMKERKAPGKDIQAPWVVNPKTYSRSVQQGTIVD